MADSQERIEFPDMGFSSPEGDPSLRGPAPATNSESSNADEPDFKLVPLEDSPNPSSDSDTAEIGLRPKMVPVAAAPTARPNGAKVAKAVPAKAIPVAGAASAKLAKAVAVPAKVVPAPAIDAPQPLGEEERETLLEDANRKKFFLSAVPSWMVSMLVHVGLILILAAISLDPVTRVLNILEATQGTEEEPIEQFDLKGPSIESVAAAPMTIDAPVEQAVSVPEISAPEAFASMDFTVSANSVTESIMPSALMNSSLSQMTSALSGRSASKGDMLARYGGTAASEAAVARALKWIAAHQAPDGGWTFAHSAVCKNACKDAGDMFEARNGATALALLPFLGAGQTHMEGQYKRNIYRGLAFLIQRIKVKSGPMPEGSWHEPGGRMYSHGLAAICICEAYAMTEDPDLLQPAQLSLNYLIRSQHPTNGGWRYTPGQPGDTSVVGWCLMALKSGKMGGLVVPQHTLQKTDRFLDFVSTNNGAYYGYKDPAKSLKGRDATIAVGLLCRMYMGYPKAHPGMQLGIEHLAKKGPSTKNLYFSYYATQVMRHHGGDVWDRWNKKMRDSLVASQTKSGHATGSWYESGNHTKQGGRLYTTALATMILEVYYRHMPLYSEGSLEDDFEI